MRRRIKLGMVSLFAIIVGLMAYQFYDALQEKEKRAKIIENLPEFSLYDTQSKLFTDKGIRSGTWAVFIFFNSECHYCQEEAQQLSELKAAVQYVNFIWISTESMTTINEFQERYQLSEKQNSIFLQDKKAFFSTELGIEATPQFLIYAPNGKLVKNHKGAWRVDKLLEIIANEIKTP